ncbi:MAG: outer membrane beta-barrel protein [Gemmatimonadota bacterium]
MIRRDVLVIAVALLAAPTGAHAQGIHVTPAIGVFIPASDLQGVQAGAEDLRGSREGTLGLGLNIEAGWLRGSLAYASGASVSLEDGGTEGEVGDGSVLAVAADIVVRPLPRLLVQPYLLGGIGFKRQDYSYDDEGAGSNPFTEEQRDVALHVGIGGDVMLGGLGVMAEITDYITRTEDDDWGQHDAFLLVGLRFRLGGGG